jgi:penicillin-binding protein 2
VEKVMESRLAARPGHRIVDRDARGRVREVLEESPARDGEDVRLSIDLGLQKHMADALARAARSHGARGAFFIAMDPATGEVLVFTGWAKEKDGMHLGVQATVPGSVIKVVTAIAGVESHELDPTAFFDCTGSWHRIGCHNTKHLEIDLTDALAVSCNGYFADAADRMGIDILSWWAKYLGFGRRTGIEIDREPAGLVPDAEWKMARFENSERFREAFQTGHWHRGETWYVGIGQGALMATPIQVARLMAIVANGGHAVEPTLLAGKGRLGERILEPRTIHLVRSGLEETVRRGTASRTELGRYRAAGKTGTGDLPPGKLKLENIAWFAGYAPAENPKIAFACAIADVTGYGGGVAGPVCVEFLKEFTKP